MNDPDTEVSFIGFELSDCVLNLDAERIKYLRAIHRTALELAIPNRFGVEAGGFWLTTDQIEDLRGLSNHYPPAEAGIVAEIIEVYLAAQCELFSMSSRTTIENAVRHRSRDFSHDPSRV
ncbi:MAG TPA: hypothetical protein VGN86_09650 [Pyrinomonadaceae bacterium]|nr:hypothetical protein [Pyrinomonadaceae bacterium]